MKLNEFFSKLWETVKLFAKKLLSPILDREWDLDPYKIGGFALFAVAIKIALAILPQLAIIETDKLLSLTGLISAFITAGTFMFSHSRKSDDTLLPNRKDIQ